MPDGTSVQFSTDFGFFEENGLRVVSKTTAGGFADVTIVATVPGTSTVRASLDCAVASIGIQFRSIPAEGPFISSITPASGSCAGGDTVTITGGRFGADLTRTRVTFGGNPATLVSVSDTTIVVKTPQFTLTNPAVPQLVDVIVQLNTGTAGIVQVKSPTQFRYFCVDKRIFISSVVPAFGSPAGGETVVVNGGNFGTSIATTRVTFGGVSASIVSMSDAAITVLTPRHPLADPAVSETVDVAVTIDLGLVSEQSAVLPKSFTYRGGSAGSPGVCNTDPTFFISSITPNTGSPDGGTIVTIAGGGFPAAAANIRVDFGGKQAQVTGSSQSSLTVSTPQRTLANPDVAETVDVQITDLGSPNPQRCARLANAFTYTRQALQPIIFSVSPRTGPNDASTRVSIFGSGFQFPMQVFMTGGGCGSARIEATLVEPVRGDTLIFATPIAQNANSCLQNQLVTIEVVNPFTGKRASCPDCFKYYACPTVTGAFPVSAPYNVNTAVTINGSNFEEPVEATFSGNGVTTRLVVTSVSSGAIVVQLPPLNPIPAGANCTDIAGTINVVFLTLNCGGPLSTGFTYTVNRPQITNAQPTQLNQDGSPFGSPLGSAPQTITVSGAFFADPTTVVLLKNGSPLDYTKVNNPSVSNPATLSFPAPGIHDIDMNTQACVVGPTVNGTRFVPTSFGIRVTNARTGCSADLPNILVYNPADASCRSLPIVTSAFIPNGTICSPYGTFQLSAAGGTPPYTWSATGLPAGLTLDATTGNITGTPILASPGPGSSSVASPVTVTVTDTQNQTTSRTYSVVINDPGGPFTITGSRVQTIPNGTSGATLTAQPAAFPPVAWSSSVSPDPAPGTINLTSTSGNTTSIRVQGGAPAGTYTVTVNASDDASNCGGANHVATPLVVTVTVP